MTVLDFFRRCFVIASVFCMGALLVLTASLYGNPLDEGAHPEIFDVIVADFYPSEGADELGWLNTFIATGLEQAVAENESFTSYSSSRVDELLEDFGVDYRQLEPSAQAELWIDKTTADFIVLGEYSIVEINDREKLEIYGYAFNQKGELLTEEQLLVEDFHPAQLNEGQIGALFEQLTDGIVLPDDLLIDDKPSFMAAPSVRLEEPVEIDLVSPVGAGEIIDYALRQRDELELETVVAEPPEDELYLWEFLQHRRRMTPMLQAEPVFEVPEKVVAELQARASEELPPAFNPKPAIDTDPLDVDAPISHDKYIDELEHSAIIGRDKLRSSETVISPEPRTAEIFAAAQQTGASPPADELEVNIEGIEANLQEQAVVEVPEPDFEKHYQPTLELVSLPRDRGLDRPDETFEELDFEGVILAEEPVAAAEPDPEPEPEPEPEPDPDPVADIDVPEVDEDVDPGVEVDDVDMATEPLEFDSEEFDADVSLLEEEPADIEMDDIDEVETELEELEVDADSPVDEVDDLDLEEDIDVDVDFEEEVDLDDLPEIDEPEIDEDILEAEDELEIDFDELDHHMRARLQYDPVVNRIIRDILARDYDRARERLNELDEGIRQVPELEQLVEYLERIVGLEDYFTEEGVDVD